MKLVVCVKQIDTIYARTGVNPETHFISEEDRIRTVNPYDELALEEALRVKDSEKDSEVILITLGDLIAEQPLRRCLATGADRLVQINDPSFGHLDAWVSSVILARAIERLEPDMILCGKEAKDDHGGQVGAYVAELLRLPYVSCVVKLEMLQGNQSVKIHRALDRGDREVLECKLPVLFSVERSQSSLRYPSVPNLLWAKDYRIECWGRERLSLKQDDLKPMTEMVESVYPRPRPKRMAAPDSRHNGFERTSLLLSGSRIEKKGHTLEGTQEELASAMVHFLKENGVLGD